MPSLTVRRSQPLSGELVVQGAKVSAQLVLPATILFPGRSRIRNVPVIADVNALIQMLRFVGADVSRADNGDVYVDATHVEPVLLPDALTKQSRGSFFFLAAMLSRFGQATVAAPGGDQLGRRPVDWHVASLRALGATITEGSDTYVASAKSLSGTVITLPHQSVGTTASCVLGSNRAEGTTVIRNASADPEVDDLIAFMASAGAAIRRVASTTIAVTGVSTWRENVVHRLIPDRRDAATFMAAVSLTGGTIVLRNVVGAHLAAFNDAASRMGIEIDVDDQRQAATVLRRGPLRSTAVVSGPYPGFTSGRSPPLFATTS